MTKNNNEVFISQSLKDLFERLPRGPLVLSQEAIDTIISRSRKTPEFDELIPMHEIYAIASRMSLAEVDPLLILNLVALSHNLNVQNCMLYWDEGEDDKDKEYRVPVLWEVVGPYLPRGTTLTQEEIDSLPHQDND